MCHNAGASMAGRAKVAILVNVGKACMHHKTCIQKPLSSVIHFPLVNKYNK